MFIASNERILCWGQTLLALKVNAFHAADEHFSAGDEHVENTCSSFSQTHTQLATSDFQIENERVGRGRMNAFCISDEYWRRTH